VPEVAPFIFQQADQKPMCPVGIHLQLVTIKTQEHIGREECDALVSVDEGVVDDERLESPKSGADRRSPNKAL
jgi:hypothetical protein